jgi:biopolymer transport protein ExbB
MQLRPVCNKIMNLLSIIAYSNQLGLMAWPLITCSIFGLAICLERTVFFLTQPLRKAHIQEVLSSAFSRTKEQASLEALSSLRSPLAQLASAYLINRRNIRSIRKEVSEGPIYSWISRARAPVKMLTTIAQVAPLMGLTGTVLGLVETFKVIQSSQQSIDPSLMAGGIWEALLTTIVGMLISMPTLVMVRLFNARIERVAREARLLYLWLESQEDTSNEPAAIERACQ